MAPKVQMTTDAKAPPVFKAIEALDFADPGTPLLLGLELELAAGPWT